MGNRIDRMLGFIVLRSSATAVSATGAGSDIAGARISNYESGVAYIDVTAANALTSATVLVEGRDNASGSYTTLATFTVTAVGQQVQPIDRLKNRLRYNVSALTGTSLTFSMHVIGELAQYLPGGDIITS